MSDEFLGDRKKALEEAFFAKQNAALLERIRKLTKRSRARSSSRAAATSAMPADRQARRARRRRRELDRAVARAARRGGGGRTGKLEAGERKAILAAAADEGNSRRARPSQRC